MFSRHTYLKYSAAGEVFFEMVKFDNASVVQDCSVVPIVKSTLDMSDAYSGVTAISLLS